MLPVDEQMKIITSGAAQIVPEADLRKKLEKGTPLNIKLGVDPTSPDLHLGHAECPGRLHLGQILKVAQLDQATLLLLEQMQQLPGQHPVQEGLGIIALIHEPVTEYERCTVSLSDRLI